MSTVVLDLAGEQQAALHPALWVLATALLVLLGVAWTEAFVRHARLGEPFVEDDSLG